MNGGSFPRAGVASRKKCKRGLMSVEDSMELGRVDIDSYIVNREENLLTATRVTTKHRENPKPKRIKKQE